MDRHEKFMEDLQTSVGERLVKLRAKVEDADVIIEDDNLEVAKVCGKKGLPTSDKSEWDGSAAEERVRKWAGGPDKENIDWGKYGNAFVWVMPGQEKEFTGYKLPFADIIGGKLTATWGGVSAAMAAVHGSRGGTKGVDVQKAHNFLASYYKKFDKEVPEM